MMTGNWILQELGSWVLLVVCSDPIANGAETWSRVVQGK